MDIVSLPERAVGSLLAAAAGDALGWPHEDHGKRRVKGPHEQEFHGRADYYRDWTRKIGSRFQPVEEPMAAGSYSDDTQLLLATGRALLQNKEETAWFDAFAKVELPTWLLYERGGGGATKRAAKLWLTGKLPWRAAPKETQSYFDAGGNGVAMRILPHVIASCGKDDFVGLGRAIFLNGITTHGHPRALVGALVYGYTLSLAFRRNGSLGYGELLARCLEGEKEWGELPEALEVRCDWYDSRTAATMDQYRRSWREVVQEMVGLLKQARNGILHGALAVDKEILSGLGSFDRKQAGAGTVGAAAAIFLASRYAVNPRQGLELAATRSGLDTDTIASMTGGILGALAGTDWLGEFGKLQDQEYMQKLAGQLALGRQNPSSALFPLREVTRTAQTRFLSRLAKASVRQQIQLPDGRTGVVDAVIDLHAASSKTRQRRWSLQVEDGQIIYVNHNVKLPAVRVGGRELPTKQNYFEFERAGFRIWVNDLKRAKDFYLAILNLPLNKETATGFTAAEILTVQQSNETDNAQLSLPSHNKLPVVFLKFRGLDSFYEYIQSRNVPIRKELSNAKSRRRFQVCDPEGNVIEIFEGSLMES